MGHLPFIVVVARVYPDRLEYAIRCVDGFKQLSQGGLAFDLGNQAYLLWSLNQRAVWMYGALGIRLCPVGYL
ncbi:hypothetical protein GCM10007159_05300 [Modicisalibacter luteus]|nr:hypothetical protein GCM10007159_05300 [Halomonas lutea]